jgi:hypothetical protein
VSERYIGNKRLQEELSVNRVTHNLRLLDLLKGCDSLTKDRSSTAEQIGESW